MPLALDYFRRDVVDGNKQLVTRLKAGALWMFKPDCVQHISFCHASTWLPKSDEIHRSMSNQLHQADGSTKTQIEDTIYLLYLFC